MESDSNSGINTAIQTMDIKVKEEPVYPDGTLTQVKSESAEVENFETVFVPSDCGKDCSSDSEMCNKKESIWNENTSKEIKQEVEEPSAVDLNLKNNTEDAGSYTEVITGDVVDEETSRFHTKPIYRNSDRTSYFYTSTNSEDNCLRKDDLKMIIPAQMSKSQVILNSDTKTSFTPSCRTVSNCVNGERSSTEPPKAGNCELVHKGKISHTCGICNKSFTQKSYLKMHKVMHEAKSSHTCEVCNKSFIRATYLKKHKLDHEGKRLYICEVCNKSFVEAYNLRQHKLIHEGKKPHTCEICSRSFSRVSHLKEHKLLIHDGRRPHTCEICSRGFSRVSHLEEHKLLIHEGQKPHTCEICNGSFTRVSHLKDHKLLIHEGKRPHTCEVCNRRFAKASNLKQHKLIHEGRKPYTCEVCNKSFTQASVLTRHKLVHQRK